jgi:hypothetical protein
VPARLNIPNPRRRRGVGAGRELPPGGSRSRLRKLTQRRGARLRGRFDFCIKQVSPKLLPPVAQCLASSMEAVEMLNSLISRFSDGLELCLFVLHHITYFTRDIPSPDSDALALRCWKTCTSRLLRHGDPYAALTFRFMRVTHRHLRTYKAIRIQSSDVIGLLLAIWIDDT